MTTNDREENPPRINDPILTTEELAARWKISTDTIRRMIRDGLLRHIPIGQGARKYSRGPSQYRFRIEDILAFEQTEARIRRPPTPVEPTTKPKPATSGVVPTGPRTFTRRSGRKK